MTLSMTGTASARSPAYNQWTRVDHTLTHQGWDVCCQTDHNCGDKCFAAAGPQLWNSLPADPRQADTSFQRFKRQLKTFCLAAEIVAHCDLTVKAAPRKFSFLLRYISPSLGNTHTHCWSTVGLHTLCYCLQTKKIYNRKYWTPWFSHCKKVCRNFANFTMKTILYNAAFIPQHFSHCFLTFKLLGALAVPLGHLRRPNLDFYWLTDWCMMHIPSACPEPLTDGTITMWRQQA